MTRRSINSVLVGLFISLAISALPSAVSAADVNGGGSAPAGAAQPICTDAPDRGPLCYMPQADGSWAVEILQADGRWVQLRTQLYPPSPEELQRGLIG